jgi:hypothetical protein
VEVDPLASPARPSESGGTVAVVADRAPRWRWPHVLLWLLLCLTAVGAWAALLYPLTSLPITYDDLLYLSLAYLPRPEAWVLNRYFHISSLALFMALVEQPFDAARWWWSCTAGAVLTAMILLLRSVPAPARPAALVVLALLLFSRVSYSWYLGIPYADFSVMLMLALSAALVGEAVFARRNLPHSAAVLLGLLLVLGFRSKETAIILLWLAPLGLLRPDGALRFDRSAWAFAGRYLLGIVLGLLVMAGCEFWLLGDPLFGLRPTSWEALLSFNTGGGGPAEYTWLTWIFRSDALSGTLLYLAAGFCLAFESRDRRQLLLFTLPIAYLLLLTLLGLFSNAAVNARTALPIQPLMAALTTVVLFRCIWTAGARALTRLAASYLIALAALGVFWLLHTRWEHPPARLLDADFIQGSLAPLMVFAALLLTLIGVVAPRWGRLPVLVSVVLILGVGLLPPGLRVMRSLQWRSVQIHAERRFQGLRELASEIEPGPDGRVLIDFSIYDGDLAGRDWSVPVAYYQLSAARRYDPSRFVLVPDLAALPIDLRPGDVVLAPPEALHALWSELNAAESAGAREGVAAPRCWQLTTAGDGRIAALHCLP